MSSQIIEITVNGEPSSILGGQTVDALLIHLGIVRERVAVELDKRIVTKRDWASTTVASGARLEIVEFVGGG